MITIYGERSRPYCRKVLRMATIVGLPYVCIGEMTEKDRAFVSAVSPNATMPVICDSDTGVAMCESNAILLYLADKTGQLLPKEKQARADVYQWLLFESSTLSAAIGEFYHYFCAAPMDIPYALDRGQKRILRCMEIVDNRLANHDYIGGEASIADVAIEPWIHVLEELADVPMATFRHVSAWAARMDTLCRAQEPCRHA